ncbi:ricin-type beta-trefoil lectin domain protein [Streptomyces griseorubiginosus]|uniref:ricin-type beta-trefoil lectin domain protein n=1 Tax=Streptomyces griseorubiginosus TaxID=67304 RepID=UPI00362D8842
MTESSPEAAAGTSAESAATPSLPRRERGPSAIAEASAAVARTQAEEPSGASEANADAAEIAPPLSQAAAEFAALTAADPAPEPATAAAPSRDTRTSTWSAPAVTTAPRAAPPTPGRPRKALLAGAALLGALLIAVPFLVTGDDGDESSTRVDSTGDTALGDHWTGDGTGTFGTASPSGGSPGPRTTANEATGHVVETGKPDKGAPAATGTTSSAPGQHTAPSASASKPAAGVRIRGSASGRCIDVTDGSTAERTPLQIWDCSGAARQSWRFASDGTVRALGRCMDVDGGSRDDGATVQLVTCNGTGAQQFRLNAAHDLVNVQADKCVDVKDVATGNGARLQLWSCNGGGNQKWSTA